MKRLAFVLALIALPALAQQSDLATMQRIAASLQQQRNEAMDKAALASARAAQLAEEVQKLKAELEKAKSDAK
jgi:hypothetical protein